MARIKYNGVSKKKVTWSSMGKAYSYVVEPGQTISVPEDQVLHACACGPFLIISSVQQIIKVGPKINKKIIKKESPVQKIVRPMIPVVNTEVEVPVVVQNEVVVIEKVEDVVVPEVVSVEPEESLEYEPQEDTKKTIDYTSIRKDDLKQMCKDRGLHTNGNRDDLITRLCNADNGIVVDL